MFIVLYEYESRNSYSESDTGKKIICKRHVLVPSLKSLIPSFHDNIIQRIRDGITIVMLGKLFLTTAPTLKKFKRRILPP